MAQIDEVVRGTQHIALGAAKREILENDECELHAAGIREKDELYAKIPPDPYFIMQTTTISIRAISSLLAYPADFKLDRNTGATAREQHIGLQQPYSTTVLETTRP
jgi:hypothetical protein